MKLAPQLAGTNQLHGTANSLLGLILCPFTITNGNYCLRHCKEQMGSVLLDVTLLLTK
jgi:hypothetical protein